MSNHCVPCQPQQVMASKKMLCLGDDPSTTVWVCDSCALRYAEVDNYVIGNESTIEAAGEEEEAMRDHLREIRANIIYSHISNPNT